MPGIIKFKDNRKIEMLELNPLTTDQLALMQKAALQIDKKTAIESDEFEVKLRLTPEQINTVIKTKNDIFGPNNLWDISKLIKFSPHSDKRIAYRLGEKTPDDPVSPQSRKKVVKLLRDAKVKDVDREATWSGEEALGYKINGVIDEKEIAVVISFKKKIVVVTLIDKNASKKDYGFSVEDQLSLDHLEILKRFK